MPTRDLRVPAGTRSNLTTFSSSSGVARFGIGMARGYFTLGSPIWLPISAIPLTMAGKKTPRRPHAPH